MTRARTIRSAHVAALVATVLLGACVPASPDDAGTGDQDGNAESDGVGEADGDGSDGEAPEPGTTAVPDALVGFWDVDVPGTPGLIARVGSEFQVYLPCGQADGPWRAHPDGRFVFTPYGWSRSCGSDPFADDRALGWLTAARTLTTGEGAAELRDANGAVLATLAPLDALPDDIDAWDGFREAPATGPQPPTPEEAPDLPRGLDPATPDELIGRWEVLGTAVTEQHDVAPFLELDADGSVWGSDGCNGSDGRWSGGDDGTLIAVMGVSTLIGCDGAPTASWLTGAARAGLDGDGLALIDADGAELGRLTRAGDAVGAVDPHARPTIDPAALVGFWHVDAPGSEDGVLRIGADLLLARPCGHAGTSWRLLGDGRIVMMPSAWHTSCGPEPFGDLQWLLDARRIQAGDAGAELLDENDEVLATLARADALPESPDIWEAYYDEPTPPELPVTPLMPSDPAAATAGPFPAGDVELFGRWETGASRPGGWPEQPYVDFSANGDYTGSDGCNGVVGRWAASDDGAIVAVDGGQRLLYCDNIPVPDWIRDAAAAALDGDELILIDAEGAELGRLNRA